MTEKPMDIHLQKIDAMIAATQRNGTKLGVIFGCCQQIGNSFEGLFSLFFTGVVLQYALVGSDSVTGPLDIVGQVNSGLVLLMDYPGDENRSCLITWIEIERPFGMLLGILEMTFAVSARGFV